MKTTRFLFLFLIAWFPLRAQVVDTLELKKEIDQISNKEGIQAYLDKLYEEDQAYRGRQTSDSLDYRHLLSVSYFINRFGYPKVEDFGRSANAPWLVWIHNKHSELNRLAFPVILQGFLAREIPEEEIRTYYLDGLYQSKFADERYRSLALKELFAICEVATGPKIDIQKMILAKQEIDRFYQIPVKWEYYYQDENTTQTYALNGQELEATFEGETIRLFELENGRIYLEPVYPDGSGEPFEVVAAGNIYRRKGQAGDLYYEVTENQLSKRTSRFIITTYLK
jgi:hypothetical protein